jgi:hypothetical protein
LTQNPARILFILILLAYLIIGALFALYTPAWQAPDEPAHFNYVAQVATNGCCPVIEIGDWDSAYLERLKSRHFNPELLGNLSRIQYEDHQPPLYYLLAAPLYSLTNGSLTALRLFSVACGAIIVICAYAISRLLIPERPWVALGAAAFTAFLPQNLAILASVNNDALSWALIALTLLVTVGYLKNVLIRSRYVIALALGALLLAMYVLFFAMGESVLIPLLTIALFVVVGALVDMFSQDDDDRAALMLGLLVGLIFMTKTTGYFLAGVVPLAIALKWWTAHALEIAAARKVAENRQMRRVTQWIGRKVWETPFLRRMVWNRVKVAAPKWLKRQWEDNTLLRHAVLFLVPALLLGMVWWGRNLSVYGAPDFLGLRAHDSVVADQLRTEDLIARETLSGYVDQLVETTFTSFWGQFGWMALPLNGWMLLFVQVLTALAVGGWVVRVILNRQDAKSAKNTDRGNSRNAPRGAKIILTENRAAWIVLIASGVLVVLAYVYYNTEFVQFQGRYLYAGLIPFALAFALGFEGWGRLLLMIPNMNAAIRPYIFWIVTVVPLLLLAPFSLYTLWRVIVPGLAP